MLRIHWQEVSTGSLSQVLFEHLQHGKKTCPSLIHMSILYPHYLPQVRPTQSIAQCYCTKEGHSK